MALRRRQAQAIGDGASSNKIDCVTQVLAILNPKGYQNCMVGSKFMAVLLNGWILPNGRVT